MNSSDLIQVPTLQRLDELSQFQSCIKNFGRSILPPVLLAEHKNELFHLRAEAINKEADLAKRRKERLNLSEKVRAVFEKIEKTQCSALSGNDISPNSTDYQRVENKFPPFPQSPQLKALNASHSGINESFAVHQNTTSDSYEQLLKEHVSSCKLEEKRIDNVEGLDSDSSDIHYCKDGTVSEVSDDGEVSVIDETDGGSLPTVIFAAKQQAFSQDTDCESIATSVGQSTDLEKYLDCSMETSNASDSCTTASEARDSSQLYCASDDLSSNTAVNTESEITPTESAMAEYDEEAYGSLKENEVNVCGVGETHQNESRSKRADSVDSYLGILKLSAKQLYGKKSLSDQNIYSPDLLDSANNDHIFYDEFEDSKITVVDNRPAVDIESQQGIDYSQNQLAIDGTDEGKTFMPRHIRRNSYTLDEPSDALVQAHANCSCSLTSSKCSSPHSVPIRSNSVPAMSKSYAAFVKEKVTLLPLQLTSKYKCVFELDGSSKICNTFGIQTETSSSVHGKECQAMPVEPTAVSSELASSEPHDCHAESSSGEQNEVSDELTEKIEDMYSFSPMSSEPTVDESILDKIYCELQETQKRKVEKLLEEQHKQWMKLQMEFKQQEMVFCEKIERICTPAFKDFPPANCSEVDATHSTSKDVKDNENQNMKLREYLGATESPIELNSNQEKEILRTCDIHFSIDDSQIKDSISSESTPVDQNCDTIGLMNENNVFLNSNLCEGHNINASFSNNASEDQIQTQELIESYKKLSFHNSKTTSNQRVLDNITIRPNTSWKTQRLDVSSDTTSVVSQNNCKNMLEICIQSPFQSFDEICNISQRENLTNAQNKNSIVIEGNNMSTVENDVERHVELMPVTAALSCIQASKFAVPSKLSSQKCHLLNVCLNDPVLNKKFEKVSATVKGYLTRRLFRTEKVQGLIKMLKDTVILLKKMDDDIDTKMKNITNNANLHSQLNITEHDVEFHRQLIVQLQTIFDQIYGIFCEISTKERMKIISESRQLSRGGHIQAKVATPISPSLHIISMTPPLPTVHPKPKLSAATIKVLERKKIRSALENRTYTINDFRSKISHSRTRASTLSKSHSLSPTSVYKTSASVINKKKLSSTTKSSTSRRILK